MSPDVFAIRRDLRGGSASLLVTGVATLARFQHLALQPLQGRVPRMGPHAVAKIGRAPFAARAVAIAYNRVSGIRSAKQPMVQTEKPVAKDPNTATRDWLQG